MILGLVLTSVEKSADTAPDGNSAILSPGVARLLTYIHLDSRLYFDCVTLSGLGVAARHSIQTTIRYIGQMAKKTESVDFSSESGPRDPPPGGPRERYRSDVFVNNPPCKPLVDYTGGGLLISL